MRGKVFAPWMHPGALWRHLTHVLLDAPLGLLSCTMVVTLVVVSVSTAVVLPVAVIVFGALLALARLAAWLVPGLGLVRGVTAEAGYGTFAVPVGPLAIVLVVGAFAGVLAAVRPARRAARIDVLAAVTTE